MADWSEYGREIFVRRYRSLDLNIGAVICGDGVLLIDTRAHHAQARELQSDLARLTRHPVRWVVNTHHHWDHTFGNALFRPAPIWGHARCAEVLRDRGAAMLEQLKAEAPDHADAFDEVVITPPDHTFATEATLALADRTIRLRHLGRGHTDNDIVVEIPDGGLLFAGDLIEEGNPPAFQDAFPLEWPETIRALVGSIRGPVIPGHGAAVDGAFVEAQQRDLQAVADLAIERHSAGMPVAAAAAAGGPFPRRTLQHAFVRAWPVLDTTG